MLEEAWTGGSRGHMSAVAEARAWALREVWREQHQGKGDYGLLSFVAARVKKVGGGNPSPSAVSQFFEKVDEDEGWFPGKRSEAAYGPKPVLHGAKRRRVAQKAMDMKESGVEPTYSRMVTDCGEDVMNPKLGDPSTRSASTTSSKLSAKMRAQRITGSICHAYQRQPSRIRCGRGDSDSLRMC